MFLTVMVIIVIIIKNCKIVPNFLIGFEIFIPQIKYQHFTLLKIFPITSYDFLVLFMVFQTQLESFIQK